MEIRVACLGQRDEAAGAVLMRLLSRLVKSRSVISGAALYIAMRWFDRAIGVVSTIVLARLLAVEDFGLVALASVVLGLATVLLDMGINLTVVQRHQIDRDDLDTAWSLRLLQNGIIAIALVIASTWIASYYGDSRLRPVILVLALAYLLDGFTGLGPVMFQKRREYAKEVAFFMAKRLFGFSVTVGLAVWMRSYWALVLGSLGASLFGMVLSYWMYRERPRFRLTRWRRFVGASSWLTIRSIGGYARTELDKFVLGQRGGAPILGAYAIADQIAALPSSELLQPTSRALFPAMAAKQDEPDELRRLYLAALGVQVLVALPASVGLAMVAHDLVLVALGPKWLQAVPILVALAMAYAASAISISGNYLLVTIGAFRAQALIHWALAFLLAALVFIMFPNADALQIAWFRAALGVCGTLAVIGVVRHHFRALGFRAVGAQVWRPALACVLMSVAVWVVSGLDFPLPLLRLGLSIATGVTIYPVALLALWRTSGCPDGAEAWFIDRLRGFWNQHWARRSETQ